MLKGVVPLDEVKDIASKAAPRAGKLLFDRVNAEGRFIIPCLAATPPQEKGAHFSIWCVFADSPQEAHRGSDCFFVKQFMRRCRTEVW
ncbi:hypothetical protein Pla144_01540 [Bythopirellula polymerisocia]|uniref:Uncharacterized protein n=1 Tax=Bythopirellula polymerisocia TaxID=2528003 RepID=A0A5C6D146_9BACT|nr:hypothetical protein Pla144_01540 [Bythopirellula polymerisocia]